jgi:hypothetical protein
LLEKLLPASQQLFFFIKTEHFTAYNWRAGLERKHIPDKNFALSVDFDYVGDLDNWVHFSLRKSAFFSGALDIKAQNTQRSKL